MLKVQSVTLPGTAATIPAWKVSFLLRWDGGSEAEVIVSVCWKVTGEMVGFKCVPLPYLGWATPANFSGPSNQPFWNREAIKINKVSIWIYAWVTKAPKCLCLAILVGSNDSAPLQVGDRPSPGKIAKAGHLPTKMFHSFSTSKWVCLKMLG